MIYGLLLTGILGCLPVILWLTKRYYPNCFNWIKQNLWIKPQVLFMNQVIVPALNLPDHNLSIHTYYLLWSIAGGSAIALAMLTYNIAQGGILTTWNLPLYHFMRGLRSPDIDAFWVTITLVNSSVMTSFWIVMSTYLLRKKDIWRAIHWIALGLFLGMIISGLKFSTAIPRPGAIFPIRDAFPSAHVATNTTLFGALLLFFNLKQGTAAWTRWLVYALYGIWISLIAFSRVYLAAHWLTDILGGILISLISLSVFALSYYQKKAPEPHQLELASMAFGGFSAICLVRFILEYEKLLKFYMASF